MPRNAVHSPEVKERQFGQRQLEWRLGNPARRALFAGAISILAIPLAYKAARIGAAAALDAFGKKANIGWAMRLDPANPSYYEQMGMLYQTAAEAGSQESIAGLRKAVDLEPQNGSYWNELGRSCEFAGDEDCARNAFDRAVALAPMTPSFEWQAANNDLLAGLPDRAIGHFRRLLEMDPGYGGAVFTACLRAYGSAQFVARRILPQNADATLKLAFMNELIRQGDGDVANQLWAELVSSRERFPFSAAAPYLEGLISSSQIAQAKNVWRDMERLGTLPGNETENPVYDPEFEWNPIEAGFDWRTQNVPYVEAQFGDPAGYQGRKALRIDYDFPENETSEPVFQLVPVDPDSTYRLSAWVRSDRITSDSGPRLRVTDSAPSSCPEAETEGTTGTTGWHEVSVTFATCENTELVRLSIWRPRGYDFPHDISGHFWVDDVKLEAENSASVQTRAARRP